jgi:uncharacterized protein YcnI
VNRPIATAVLVTGIVAGGAAPASPHAALEQGRASRSSDTALTMRVPVEPPGHGGGTTDLAARHNQRILVVVPDGFGALGCDPKPGWTCAVNPP